MDGMTGVSKANPFFFLNFHPGPFLSLLVLSLLFMPLWSFCSLPGVALPGLGYSQPR